MNLLRVPKIPPLYRLGDGNLLEMLMQGHGMIRLDCDAPDVWFQKWMQECDRFRQEPTLAAKAFVKFSTNSETLSRTDASAETRSPNSHRDAE